MWSSSHVTKLTDGQRELWALGTKENGTRMFTIIYLTALRVKQLVSQILQELLHPHADAGGLIGLKIKFF